MTELANARDSQQFDLGDLTPIELNFSFSSKQYVLREASEEAAVQYDNACMDARVYVDGKLERLENLADVEPLLVSLCVFEKRFKEDGTTVDGFYPVSDSTVRSWPARLVKQLYEKAKLISGMEKEKELGKNSPTSTATGST
jgi:hypothetical protein